MSADNHDTGETAVALVAGVLIGFAATLLYLRIKNNYATGTMNDDDYYHIDGGDLFV